MHRSSSLVLAAALVLASGCAAKDRKYLEVSRESLKARSPVMQQELANAVGQAVGKLDFSKLAGKTVRVEVNGVMPHSKEELQAFVQTSVEAQLVRGGARIVAAWEPCPGPAPAGAAAGAPMLVPCRVEQPVDARVVVSITAGGIAKVVHPGGTDMLGLKIAALAVGSLITAGLVVATVDDFDTLPGAIAGGVAGIGGPTTWIAVSRGSSSLQLVSTMNLVVNVMPREGGVTTSAAAGTSAVEIDPTNEESYLVE